MENVNLNLLRAIYILLQEGHVSRAAARLHITQSAMSRQLAQCRELFGDPLLVRDGNTLQLTPRACQLQLELDNLFGQVDKLLCQQSFEPGSWRGELRFASSDYVAQYVMPGVMAHLHQSAPQARLDYRLWQSAMLEDFSRNELDLASTMLPEPPKGLSSQKIGQDHPVCLMAAAHPLAKVSQADMTDLAAYPHVKVTGGGDKDSSVERDMARAGSPRRVQIKVPFFAAAVNHLIHGEMLMLCPEHIARNLSELFELTWRPLAFETEPHQYWLIWHPKQDHDACHRWLREEILKAMQWNTSSIHMI